MKNREKFAERIIDIALQRDEIAVNLTSGEPCACRKTRCSECLFSGKNKDCEFLLKEWAKKEYEEPSVDWSKVPVDTPIYVRRSEDEQWKKRHFAKYEYCRVHTWCGGATSWSSDADITAKWEFAKLAEEVES